MSAVPAPAAAVPPPGTAQRLDAARHAFLFGNFVIGCGVMVVAGTLNDIARSLQVSVALAGQLIAIAAAVLAFGAPLAAGLVAGWDRRRLLAWAMVWYAVGHLLCSFMPDYTWMWPVRAASVLAAAVFTPQAAAAIGHMAPPERRGRAITYIFLGWSLASVLGMPFGAWIGESFGWRWAFRAVALLSVAAAAWVAHAVPDGVRPAALSRRAWGDLLTRPLLMGVVAVTALSAAGQFTVFSYLAPYYRQALGADAGQTSLLFGWFGAFGVIGNVLLTRLIDRTGADRAVNVLAASIGLSLALWPLATGFGSMLVVLVPWALGCFALNSAQQARVALAAPELAPALMALNTSAIYLGQAVGAAGGGWLVSHGGYAPLNRVGLAWLAAALALSVWLGAAHAARGGGLSSIALPPCRSATRARIRPTSPHAAQPHAAIDLPAPAEAPSPSRRRRRGAAALPAGPRPAPGRPRDLFLAFNRMALQGFGGVLAVAQLELVDRLRWLSREEYVELLSLGQVLPGPNVVNLSLMVGDRFFGLRGAFAALAGMLALPLVIVLVLAVALRPLGAPAGGGRRAARHGRGGGRAGHRQRRQAGAGAQGQPARAAAGGAGLPAHLLRRRAAAPAADLDRRSGSAGCRSRRPGGGSPEASCSEPTRVRAAGAPPGRAGGMPANPSTRGRGFSRARPDAPGATPPVPARRTSGAR